MDSIMVSWEPIAKIKARSNWNLKGIQERCEISNCLNVIHSPWKKERCWSSSIGEVRALPSGCVVTALVSLMAPLRLSGLPFRFLRLFIICVALRACIPEVRFRPFPQIHPSAPVWCDVPSSTWVCGCKPTDSSVHGCWQSGMVNQSHDRLVQRYMLHSIDKILSLLVSNTVFPVGCRR